MSGFNDRVNVELFNYVVAVYDPEQVGTIINIFENQNRTARALGVKPDAVMKAYTNRERIWSPVLKKEVAPRSKKKEPWMIFNNGILQKRRKQPLPQ